MAVTEFMSVDAVALSSSRLIRLDVAVPLAAICEGVNALVMGSDAPFLVPLVNDSLTEVTVAADRPPVSATVTVTPYRNTPVDSSVTALIVLTDNVAADVAAGGSTVPGPAGAPLLPPQAKAVAVSSARGRRLMDRLAWRCGSGLQHGGAGSTGNCAQLRAS